MPPDVAPDAFLCDDKCSVVQSDDINVHSWFTHVLPQLRQRWAPVGAKRRDKLLQPTGLCTQSYF